MQFLWWVIYQGTVIMLLSALLFKDAFANVVLIVFCCLGQGLFEAKKFQHTWI